MSIGQQPSQHQPVSTTWTEPPWSGWIETTRDALLILEAARRGLIPRVTRRLVDSERKMITSGSVFVFDEEESGIKRWTDGFYWSPSRILGNFLLYRETDKGGAGHRNNRPDQEPIKEVTADGLSLSRPKTDAGSPSVDRNRERSLVGSLTNSYKFKQDGLMKKTFSLTIAGVAQHLISYYNVEDVETGRLRSPSSLPELASLDIAPEYLDKTHFRNPPKVEIGADGILRYKGEADDLDNSPTSSTSVSGPVPTSNVSPPPLISEGRVTVGLSKKGKRADRADRYDPYPPSSANKRSRKNTRSSSHDGADLSGEGTASPAPSGTNTPTITAQSPPTSAPPEPPATLGVPPPIPHPHFSYYPGYLPPGPLYGPTPPHPGVPINPYLTTAPGTNNGAPPPHPYYSGYPPTAAHPNSSAPTMGAPTQVRVSDQSQVGFVPITSQQPGPMAAASVPPGHGGQMSYGPNPHYHYPYYPPPPHMAQFQPHGYPPGPAYQWPYAAYHQVSTLPPHPNPGQQPQAIPVQANVASSYNTETTQPQRETTTPAEESEIEEGENA